uniref:Uncharacterized protein n=1 Tax=Triticum urartu TaxID=4572 RepID=A0A8R7TJY4_TRIUA
MHFKGADLSGLASGTKGNIHVRLHGTSLKLTDGHNSNTTNLVNVLKWKTQGLCDGSLGLDDLIKSLKEGGALIPIKVGRPLNHVVTLKSLD